MVTREEYTRRRKAGETPEQILGKTKGATGTGVTGALSKVGSFLGMEEFGRGLSGVAARATGATKGLSESIDTSINLQNALSSAIAEKKKRGEDTSKLEAALESQTASTGSAISERERIETGGVTGKQVLASAGQTLLNILPAARIGSGISGATKTGALAGALSGGLEGVKQDKGVIPGAIAGAVGGAAIGGALGIIANRMDALFTKYPDSLMTKFLGQSKAEILKEKTFKEAVREGGKVTGLVEKTGKVPDLSKQALEKGLRGSESKIIDQSTMKLIDLEDEVSKLVNSNSDVAIDTNKVLESLDEIAARKQNVFGDEGASLVQKFKDSLLSRKGELLSFPEALKMKRDIYKELGEAAFNRETLTAPKEVLRTTAAAINKAMIDASPELGKLNKEQQFLIRALDTLEEKVAARSRASVIGLSDIILGGGGAIAGDPVLGAGLAAVRRISSSGRFQSNAAVALDRIGKFIDAAPSVSALKIAAATKIPKASVEAVLRELPKLLSEFLARSGGAANAKDGAPL